jgi:transposase-like protein
MKAKSRRQFTSTFKAKVVLEVLRQEKTLSQIASENELHPQLLQTWKQTFLAAASQVFDQQKGAEKPASDETAPLYEQIGRLQMEVTWLKKKLPANL